MWLICFQHIIYYVLNLVRYTYCFSIFVNRENTLYLNIFKEEKNDIQRYEKFLKAFINHPTFDYMLFYSYVNKSSRNNTISWKLYKNFSGSNPIIRCDYLLLSKKNKF